MRICFDVDGTISTSKPGGGDYRDVVPLPGAIETLKRLKAEGHYIILQTARHMVTYASNEGKILANFGYFYEWLAKWEVPYDEIYIGKPHADLFIDDKGRQHLDWTQTADIIDRYKESHP
jgi:capsule biosynthesis phosphatase